MNFPTIQLTSAQHQQEAETEQGASKAVFERLSQQKRLSGDILKSPNIN